MRRQKLFLVYFNISLVCVLLVGMELLGQVAFLLRYGHPLFVQPDTTTGIPFEPHPYLVGRLKGSIRIDNADKTMAVTSTPIHTRYTGAPADDHNAIRIAVLGGSTTFGTRVTDEDSWPALLQSALGKGYSVINYGVPGYSTAEAIIQMALIVPEKVPHVVVFYEGWNDIRNYHDPEIGSDYFSHGMHQYGNLRIQARFGQNREPLISRLAQISAIVRFASHVATLLPQRSPQTTEPVYATPDTFVDRIYLRNLKTLKSMAQALNAKVIFIPQVLNFKAFEGKKGSRGWTPRIEDDAMPALLDRFNDFMNGLCAPREANCVVLRDVRREDWQSADFIGDGHFSRSGGEKFSRILATSIRRLMKVETTH